MFKIWHHKKSTVIISGGFLFVAMMLFVGDASAAATTVGGIASQVIASFEELAKLITAASYLGGLGFSIGAIMKFKQHKDNPTQIPIGTPIALVFIASALLFLPSILSVAGGTMFGQGAKTATWQGTANAGDSGS